MSDDFRILFELLEPGWQEVRGRGALPVPSALREKIVRFAAGKSNEEERNEMKKMLTEKPELIPILADEVRALREALP